MPLWTLDEVTPLRLYQADELSLSDNDAVASWTDTSTNADPAVQSDSAKKPTFKTNIINGLPVVRLDGGDYLTFSEILNSASDTASIFIVEKFTGASQGALLSTRPNGVSTGYSLRINNDTAGVYYHTGATPNVSITTLSSTFNLIEVIRDGLDITVGANGTMASPVTLSGYNVSSLGQTLLGAEDSGVASFFTGDILDILVLPIVVDEVTRKKLEGFFLHRCGLQSQLPVDHIYYSSPPYVDEVAIGGVVAPLPSISGDATNQVVAAGSIVASRSISGKVWNTGLGDVVAPICEISGEAENQVPAIGRVTLRGRISGAAYNPVASVAGVTAKLPRISGRAVNQELVSGGVSARGMVWGRATNPKAFEPIRFRRCGT